MGLEIRLLLGLIDSAEQENKIVILDWNKMETTPLGAETNDFQNMYAEVLDFCANEGRKKW